MCIALEDGEFSPVHESNSQGLAHFSSIILSVFDSLFKK